MASARDRVADAEECKNKGNDCLQANDFNKAIEWYTEAIKLHESHVYYSNRSAAYLSKGYGESALKDADKCIQLKPDWAKGYSRKGAALHKMKQYEKAIDAYKKGLELEPENAGLISGLEAVEEEKANPYGSQPKYAPNGVDAARVGNMFANMMDTITRSPKLSRYLSDPSYVQMVQSIQKDPNSMTQYLNDPRIMETFTEMMGLDPEIMAQAEKAGKQEKEKEEAEKKKKEAERKKREEEEKKRKEEESFKALPEDEKKKILNQKKAVEHKNKGNEFYKNKEFDKAIEEYDQAILLDPTEMSFLTNKAAVVLEKSDLEGCVELCEKAIEVGRQHQADYENIAKAYARMGNAYLKHEKYEEAITYYTKAQLEKKSPEVEKKLKMVEKKKKDLDDKAYIDPVKGAEAKAEGNELFKNGDFPGSIKAYSEAIKRDPTCAVYYSNRAAAYMKMADFGRAMSDCKKAIELDPKFVKAYVRKGNIEIYLKEYHKAMDSFKAGLAIEENNAECNDGLQRVNYAISQNNGQGDEERARRAMEDPEIRNIMSDPVMKQVLSDMSTDPKSAQKHMTNPDVASKVEKLIAAGIIHTR